MIDQNEILPCIQKKDTLVCKLANPIMFMNICYQSILSTLRKSSKAFNLSLFCSKLKVYV